MKEEPPQPFIFKCPHCKQELTKRPFRPRFPDPKLDRCPKCGSENSWQADECGYRSGQCYDCGAEYAIHESTGMSPEEL